MATTPVRADWIARILLGVLLAANSLCDLAADSASWNNAPGHRWKELSVPADGRSGFTRLRAGATGITFTNHLAESRSIINRNLLSGSGVAAGDVDGDGLCDLYFCRLDGDNVLYRNLGNWRFEDITARAGVACSGLDSMGATFADIDGDGDLDLLVNTLGGGTRVFENDGKGTFKDVTAASGLASRSGSMSMALGDVDGNGSLDLYVANYRPTTIMDRPTTTFRFQMVDGVPLVALVDGRPATLPEYTNRFVLAPSGRVMELGEADVLYLNDGRGRFAKLSFTNGAFLDEDGDALTDAPRDWSLAVQIHDLNDDGAPDIYVCSDLFTPDRIWINDGRGRFRALPRLALRNTSTFSMGVDFADINRDGVLDFFVTDMLSRSHVKRHVQVAESSPMRWPVGVIDNRPQFGRNTLQFGRGDGTFAEISHFSGLEASEWSWGPIFLDVDLDGYEDLLIPNGQWGDFQNADVARQFEQARANRKLNAQELADLMRLYPKLETANLLFRNRGDSTFEEVGAIWGFNDAGISQGMCLADLDGDGDLDVIVNNLKEEAGIYRNEGGGARVGVRLVGGGGNSGGVGARITVSGGAVREQSQEMICGGRYLSGDEGMRVFAAGSVTNELTVRVRWRSGRVSTVKGARANRLYEIHEAGAEEVAVGGEKEGRRVMFEDVSGVLGHRHVEEPYDDFARQPLLPRRLSQLGPGVGWMDVDGDGLEDLVVGSGRGGSPGLHLNDGRGGFRAVREGIWGQVVTRDQTAVVGLVAGRVLVGSSNYEDGLAVGGAVKMYEWGRAGTVDVVGGQEWSVGPMAVADVDGDGDLDVFVGGRVVPGRYAEGADSLLLRNEGGRFEVMQKFEKMGLVSGAVFSDLDGDGWPELIVACEWGPVRVYRREEGSYREITERLGLGGHTGWWSGVSTGDLDGDGRLDLVVGNWGLNSRYRASEEHPRWVRYGDVDGNGTVEVIESYYEGVLKKEVPERGLRTMGQAVPAVQERWRSHDAYGRASVQEIFGVRLEGLERLEARRLESTLFLNRGGRFEAVALPGEAQWAPVQGVNVGDMDGDGREDVYLSQNFFAVNVEQGRSDAGRGLWLRGDGGGGLEAVRGQESGVKVYGEQRGSALGDYDGDGRVDLVVTQNGQETKLYRNVGARVGLMIRLRGGEGNPWGVGGKVRLVGGGRKGPVREVRAGGGYWSQDSAVQVMALEGEEATEVWVQWPGGRTTTSPIPTGAREIEILPSGEVKRTR